MRTASKRVLKMVSETHSSIYTDIDIDRIYGNQVDVALFFFSNFQKVEAMSVALKSPSLSSKRTSS